MSVLVGIATGAKLHNGKSMEADLDACALTGAHSLRFGIDFPKLDPHLDGHYDFTDADALINGCVKRGMIPTVGLTGYGPGTDLYTPELAPKYVRAQAAIAQRFQGKTAGHEGPNEPNHVRTSTSATAANFVNMICKPTYDAIKKVAPSAFVVSGGLGGEKNAADPGTAADYVAAMYAAGFKGYCDALGFHAYCYPDGPLASLANMVRGWYNMRLAHRFMRANGEGDKPIWCTENGVPTLPRSGHPVLTLKAVSETMAAQQLDEAVTDFVKHPWGANGAYYHFCMWSAEADTNNGGDWMGLLRADGSRKATWDTFKKLALAHA